MVLFKIDDSGSLKKISKRPLPNEKHIQKLIEKNLEEIFGIRFLETEYSIPGGRIDTLGIDEKNTPVVIEYKNKQDESAIIQGLFYINWIKENRRTFEMLVREKLGKETTVDWSLNPRLIIIAEAFNPREISAINQVKVKVELKKHSYYGDMVSIEDFKTTGEVSTEDIKTKQETPPPTIEELLNRASPAIKEAFLTLRDKIFRFGDDVEEITTSTMICYYSGGKGMAWFECGKRLKIHLRKGEYQDKKNKLNPGWGGYPEISVKEDEIDIDYLADLLLQAYQM